MVFLLTFRVVTSDVVSLAEARKIAVETRLQLLKGLDPINERKQANLLKQARTMTFEEAAERCIANNKPEWKNAKHTRQ